MPSCGRRAFLRKGSLAAAGTALASRVPEVMAADAKAPLFAAVGIAASLNRAEFLKSQGIQFLTESTGDFLMPDKDDAAFAKSLERLAASPLPVLACNGFIRPANLRCIGPDANPDAVLAWADSAFARLRKAGGRFMVFGSSGARRLPDGWPKEKADEQFVSLLKKMGPLAENHGVTVTLEQLQQSECNYITRIGEAAEIIRRANHPRVRLLADLFHMSRMNDSPEDLAAAMDVIVHIEIAELKDRSVPGVAGDDFRPFFRVLRKSGYQGNINIEGKWDDAQIGPAVREILRQAEDA